MFASSSKRSRRIVKYIGGFYHNIYVWLMMWSISAKHCHQEYLVKNFLPGLWTFVLLN